MSREITRLILEIDLTCYANDARVTIAKHLINRAVNTGLISEEDMAYFLVDPDLKIATEDGQEDGMIFKIEEITNPKGLK